MIMVVDASVAAMWFLPEPFSERAAALLETDHELVAPRLIRLEVASALLKAVRRGTLEAADAGEAIRRLKPPSIRVQADAGLADSALAIADRYGGTVYDGVYIALARARGAMLATNDGLTSRTARSVGVPVWLISQPMPGALSA